MQRNKSKRARKLSGKGCYYRKLPKVRPIKSRTKKGAIKQA